MPDAFSLNKKCIIEDCNRPASFKGLCSGCYPDAKKLVESGATTWESLAKRGMARITMLGDSPFLRKFKEP